MVNSPFILVTNVYSYLNKGDAAIVISLLREINRVYDHDVLIQTADIHNDKDAYGTPVSPTLLWSILSSVRDKNIVYRIWVLVSKVVLLLIAMSLSRAFGLKTNGMLPKDLRQFVFEVQESEFVIACGGGYLRTSSSSSENTLLLYITCLNFLAGYYYKKPVYLYSQSIGPVHGKLQTRILKWALNKVTLIESREDISTKYLSSLNLSTPVFETADPVMLMGDYGVEPKKYIVSDADLHIGLTVRKWFKTEEELSRYIETIAQFIDTIAASKNAHVYYIPQVIATNFGDDDRIIARRVYEKVTSKKSFSVIEDNLSIAEIIGLCGAMDIFVGTRMHSNIFSLINHVPVVAIEYEYKTRGIMQRLRIEEMVLDIKTLELSSLNEKAKYLIDHRDTYSKRIATSLTEQIKRSASAIEIIHDDTNQKHLR